DYRAVMDDPEISTLVTRLSRPHPSGGVVIERAAIFAASGENRSALNHDSTRGVRTRQSGYQRGDLRIVHYCTVVVSGRRGGSGCRFTPICPYECGRCASASVQPGVRSSRLVSNKSGAPAAHAWGRDAVGNATGTDVSGRGNPANTSGSRCSKYGAAARIEVAIAPAASWWPYRARPAAMSELSCGQTVPVW